MLTWPNRASGRFVAGVILGLAAGGFGMALVLLIARGASLDTPGLPPLGIALLLIALLTGVRGVTSGRPGEPVADWLRHSRR